MIDAWIRVRSKVNDTIDEFFMGIAGVIISFLKETGAIVVFFWESLKLIMVPPYRFDELVKHMEFVANRSLLIIVLTGAFTGMALAFQIYLGFKMVNATNLVGSTVAVGISRELGPVLTGLIVAARAGGAMAARLGTMRVSEQIDALEVMGIDPKQYLIAPRLVAALISLPLLCGVFDFVAMSGAYLLSTNVLGLDEAIFFDKVQIWLNPRDINEGLLKSAAFGLVFSAICTYRGFNCSGGAKGVGEATNGGVVHSMVLIIVVNFFMTNIIRVVYRLMGITS
jgi:phospholipid/cholesterol/gamma-HCH transport system permease protein